MSGEDKRKYRCIGCGGAKPEAIVRVCADCLRELVARHARKPLNTGGTHAKKERV